MHMSFRSNNSITGIDFENEVNHNERMLRLQRSVQDMQAQVGIVQSENGQLCRTLDELHHAHNVLQQELHEVSHATGVSLQVLAANESRIAALQQQLDVSETTLSVFAQSLESLVIQEKAETQRAHSYGRRIIAMQSLILKPSGPAVKLSNTDEVQRLLVENEELEAQLMKREAQKKAVVAQAAQEKALHDDDNSDIAPASSPSKKKSSLKPQSPAASQPVLDASPGRDRQESPGASLAQPPNNINNNIASFSQSAAINASMSMVSNEQFVDELLHMIEKETNNRSRLFGLVDRLKGSTIDERLQALEEEHQGHVDRLIAEFETKKKQAKDIVLDRERQRSASPATLVDAAWEGTREEDRLRLAAKVAASKKTIGATVDEDEEMNIRTRLRQCSAAHGIESYRDEWSRTVAAAKGIAAMAKEHEAVEAERAALASLLQKMSSGLRTTRQSIQQLSQQYASLQGVLQSESSQRALWVADDAKKLEADFQASLRQKDDELQDLKRQIEELQVQTQKLIINRKMGSSGATPSAASPVVGVAGSPGGVAGSSPVAAYQDPRFASLLSTVSTSSNAENRSSIRRSMMFDL